MYAVVYMTPVKYRENTNPNRPRSLTYDWNTKWEMPESHTSQNSYRTTTIMKYPNA